VIIIIGSNSTTTIIIIINIFNTTAIIIISKLKGKLLDQAYQKCNKKKLIIKKRKGSKALNILKTPNA